MMNLESLSFWKKSKSIFALIEFEKQMANLKALAGKSVEGNDKIRDLVNWYRHEFVKRPEKYPGDDVPIRCVRNHVAKGCSLDLAIQNTYDQINGELKIIDIRRLSGR